MRIAIQRLNGENIYQVVIVPDMPGEPAVVLDEFRTQHPIDSELARQIAVGRMASLIVESDFHDHEQHTYKSTVQELIDD